MHRDQGVVAIETGIRRRLASFFLLTLILAATLPDRVLAGSIVDEPPRPRIGLALSGGGARGCAHVGVLKVLEENRIPVDYIAGTSMGAVVGGLYATGMSADEIEDFLVHLDWEAIAEDEPPRRERAYRRKLDDQRYIMNMEIGLDGGVLPGGLRSGQRFTFELRRHTLPVVAVDDFTKLPVPFQAVAVDLETGATVRLDHGDLARAMRASMSIPGVFTPVEIDGRLLVDGGIVDNLPVDVVREMGADIVIAVDVGDQLANREALESLFAVTSQAMTIAGTRNVEAQRHRADLVLSPQVHEFGSLDFAHAGEIIGEGTAEARRHIDDLGPLAVPEAGYAELLAARSLPAGPSQVVSRVEIRGLERVDPRIVRRVMRSRVGEPLDLSVLRTDLGRIYGLGDFSEVDYEVEPGADGLALVVMVREKRGGPFFLRNNLNLDLDDDQNSSASVLVNLTAIRLNRRGAEWRTDVRFGSVRQIETEWYQPLDFGGRWFVAPRFSRKRDVLTQVAPDQSLVEIEQVATGGALDVGLALGTYGEIRAGAFRERRVQTSSSAVTLGGWSIGVTLDRLDSIYFPRSGQLGSLEFSFSRPSLGSDDRFELAALTHVGVKSAGRHTWISWLELGSPLGDEPPPYAWFGGGGLFSFSGYRPGELFGSTGAVYRPTYFYRLGTLPPFAGKGIYAGGWLEAGNFWQTRDDVRLDDLRYAATLAIGVETVVGPAYLAVGVAEDGRRQIYLSIGPSFSSRPR